MTHLRCMLGRIGKTRRAFRKHQTQNAKAGGIQSDQETMWAEGERDINY